MFRKVSIPSGILLLTMALAWTNVYGADVSFDHYTGVNQSKSIYAKPGEPITINILNTCASKFNYELGGIPLPSPASTEDGAIDPLAALNICVAETHTITQIHDAQFGGYYISVDPINGPNVTAAKLDKDGEPKVGGDGQIEAKVLSKATYLVLVRTDQWDLAFSGGFTISDLTDPVFVTRENDMQNIVTRDSSSEDSASLGLAAMVHIYQQKRPWLAATFGIATGNGNETAYMVGPSYRFSDKAAVTFGYMFAPVDTLPNGVNIGDSIEDPNSLSNLGSRTGGGFFISISYSFVSGVRDLFETRIKGGNAIAGDGALVETPPGAGAGAGAGAGG